MLSYDEQPGFGVDRMTLEAYKFEMESILGTLSAYNRILELGSGTGLFTKVLASPDQIVVGVDNNPVSLEQARQRLPHIHFENANFESTDFAQGIVSTYGLFDLLAARYVIHELNDPIATFLSWKSLLKPGGKMVLIENCWIRTDWGWGEWGKRVDQLPLACTQTWATAVYCLQKAGYAISGCKWMESVNRLDYMRILSGFHLYMIVAEFPV